MGALDAVRVRGASAIGDNAAGVAVKCTVYDS